MSIFEEYGAFKKSFHNLILISYIWKYFLSYVWKGDWKMSIKSTFV